jgi:Ca2+-binding EF-hand superfamily protein
MNFKLDGGKYSVSFEQLKSHYPSGVGLEDEDKRSQLWSKFDINKNKKISFNEFDMGLDHELSGSLFPKAVRMRAFEAARVKAGASKEALKSKGYVTRKELRHLFFYLIKYAEIWRCFERLDQDSNAYISKDEFLKARSRLETFGIDMSDPNFQWAEADRDRSGKVHFYEFAHWAIQ